MQMQLERLIGQVLDSKYHLDKLLGQGGMGAVFLATHLGTKRPVALKVIAPQFMANEEVGERFRREAEAAGRLRHPNVVNVTDFGVTAFEREKLAYLVMEYLDGASLGEMMKQRRQLPLPLVVDIVEQICLAIGNAHKLGIIHRDLKPDNILLQPDGRGGYNVKVLDFGLAKLRDVAEPDMESKPVQMSLTDTATKAVAQTTAHEQGRTTADIEAQTQLQPPNATEIEAATLLQPAVAMPEAQTRLVDTNTETATQIQPAVSTLNGNEADDEGATRIQTGDLQRTEQPAANPATALNNISVTSSASVELTRIGSILGTPLYMSPEQCRGEVLDSHSDIYSLAVIVYQMLAGEPPFSGTMTELMTKHCDAAPPSLKEKREDVPGSVAELISMALAKNPQERPATAEVFAAALHTTAETEAEVLQQAKASYYSAQRTFFMSALVIYLPCAVFSFALSSGFNEALSKPLAATVFYLFIFLLLLMATKWNTALCTLIVEKLRLAPNTPVQLKPLMRFFASRFTVIVGASARSFLHILWGLVKFIKPGMQAFVDNALVAPVAVMEKQPGASVLARSASLVRQLRLITLSFVLRDIGICLLSLVLFPSITVLMSYIFGGTRINPFTILMVPTIRNFIIIYCWVLLIMMHTVYAAVPLATLYFKALQAKGEIPATSGTKDWQSNTGKKANRLSKATLAWLIVPLLMIAFMVASWVINIGKVETSLPDAARSGRLETVKRLLGERKDVNDTIFGGTTALMFAAKEGQIEIIKALVAAGANIKQLDNDGDDALIYAAIDNRVEAMKELIRAGANVNLQNKKGNTALFSAALKGRTAAAQLLLTEGADPTITNKEGKSALAVAEEEGHAETAELLKAAGK